MKRIVFLRIFFVVITATLIWKTQGFSQSREKITISTYYPSPYGSYEELRIFGRMTFRDKNDILVPQDVALTTTGNNLVLSIATNANLTDPIRLVFKDGFISRPLSYFVYTSSSNLSPCAPGYVQINYLDSGKKPANPKVLPTNGYYLCFRGE